MALIAPRIGRTEAAFATALEELAEVLRGIGVQGQPNPPRIPGLQAMLIELRADILAWSRDHADGDGAALAAMVCAAADVTLRMSARTIAEALALSADLPALLDGWRRDPARIVQIATRPEWLLDGWEHVCLLWRTAGDDRGRHAVLAEMSLLVPTLPREAADWTGETAELDRQPPSRHSVPLNADWRSGSAAFGLTARNERLRAQAA